jgi:hypothetical protein
MKVRPIAIACSVPALFLIYASPAYSMPFCMTQKKSPPYPTAVMMVPIMQPNWVAPPAYQQPHRTWNANNFPASLNPLSERRIVPGPFRSRR